jgi:hypothetical protein
MPSSEGFSQHKNCQKFSGETEAKQEGSVMRNEMPSQKWRKLGKQGGGHYEKRNALPAPG